MEKPFEPLSKLELTMYEMTVLQYGLIAFRQRTRQQFEDGQVLTKDDTDAADECLKLLKYLSDVMKGEQDA